MDEQPSAKKAPLIGYFIWLVFVLVVLAVAAVVGPRMWQGASFAADQRAPAKDTTRIEKAPPGEPRAPANRDGTPTPTPTPRF